MNVNFRDILIHDDQMWFSAINHNGLYKEDINSKTLSFIGHFPNEKFSTENLHSMILFYDNKLYFAPAFANYIHIYDIKKNIFISYKLPNKYCVNKYKFISMIRYNTILFFIGNELPDILKYDLQSHIFQVCNAWKNYFKTCGTRKDMPYWGRDYVIKNEHLFLVSRHNGTVLELNLACEKYYFHSVSKKSSGFSNICWNNNVFWLIDNIQKKILKWDICHNSIISVDLPNELNEKACHWNFSASLADTVYFFMHFGVLILKENHAPHIESYEKINNGKICNGDSYFKLYKNDIYFLRKINNKLFFLLSGECGIYTIDINNTIVKEKFHLQLQQNVVKNYKKMDMTSGLPYKELKTEDISAFLKVIMLNKVPENSFTGCKSYGQQILKYFCSTR